MKTSLAIVAVLLTAFLAACGGSERTGATAEEETAAGTTTSAEKVADERPPEVAHPDDWARLKRLAGRYPNLVIPRGPVPEHEVVRDLKVGKGPVIKMGDFFTVRWMSFAYKNGLQLENTWRSPAIYSYGRYIPAWKKGLPGIRVGGIRQLIAPSSLVYGGIARVYVVQVLKLQ